MACTKNQLTPREREVAGLLAQGKPQREIARELVISRRTAYVHVRRVVEKVGARSVMEAVVRLVQDRLT
jgi:two-component system, NarL family, nitrate/nitrite response regulator NarL